MAKQPTAGRIGGQKDLFEIQTGWGLAVRIKTAGSMATTTATDTRSGVGQMAKAGETTVNIKIKIQIQAYSEGNETRKDK